MALGRATIADIARDAGVSTATVDRVLNSRSGVRAPTRQRVLDIADRLGYLPETAAAAQVVARAVPRIDVVLPVGTNSFMRALVDHLREAARVRRHEADLRIHVIEGFNPDALAQALTDLASGSRGLAIVGIDHPTVREAIRQISRGGVPIITMVSDIANVPRARYVGIDNRAAGRLAGLLLGRFAPARRRQVALFAGSLSYRGHEEREMGFRHILAEQFPRLEAVELREIRDDSERSYVETRALLERYPALGGIYNIGAGNRGIARALEEAGRAQDVVFVGHELTEHTRRFLLSGTMDAVIDQNPRVEVRDALDCLVAAAAGAPPPALHPIRIQAIFRENIPET
jgi:LacI family transcriptional regulator